jgi:hypothetical protein
MPTAPGTLMKVTPDSDVPIIPKATSGQGLARLPVKKASLSARRLVHQATASNKAK